MSDTWFVKLYRKTLSNAISKNLELLWLFSALLLKASFQEKEFYLWYKKVELKPWQFVSSVRKLSVEFRVSVSKMYRMLEVLKSEHIVEHEWNTKYSLFTIVNRHKYQVSETQNGTQSRQQTKHEWDTIKNDKNNKEWKEDIFLQLYKKYPHARPAKKNETINYLKKLDSEILFVHIAMMQWEIRTNSLDPKYVPAMQRWARDFVPLWEETKRAKLMGFYKRCRKQEDIKQSILDFANDFWNEWVEKLGKEVQKENDDLFLSSLK